MSQAEAIERTHYPETDGEPMGETEIHVMVALEIIATLLRHFAGAPDVHVAGNTLVYYVEGDNKKFVVPDVYVVRGSDKSLRRTWLTWVEGKGPSFVLEVTSLSTRKRDSDEKHDLYERVFRVPEYFLFDPTGDYIPGQIAGWRLDASGVYVNLRRNAAGRRESQELGLELEVVDGRLRFYDPAAGAYVLSPEEACHQAEAGRKRAEVARGRAEEARGRAEEGHRRADEAHRRVEQERDAEREARMRLEAEVARLRAEAGS